MSLRPSKLLVLCVDRDDDVGAKAHLRTPIIGRESCLKAASALAVADPEEADANAIFAAIRQYDELSSKGYRCEVAVVAGHYDRGIKADQKLREELEEVTNLCKAEGAVFVSDGVEDEGVAPLLQSIVPVVSVRRVVVKHSQRVEESYAVLGRYLRMLAFDPRYSKYALGVPGLLFLATALLIYTGFVREAIIVILGILGGALIIRGFDLDKLIGSLGITLSEYRVTLSGHVRLFSILASLLVVLVAFYLGFLGLPKGELALVSLEPLRLFAIGPALAGYFLRSSINLLWLGLGINFSGAILYHLLRRSMKILRDMVGLVVLAAFYFPMHQLSFILTGQGSAATLFTLLFVGLSITFTTIVVARKYVPRGKKEPGP